MSLDSLNKLDSTTIVDNDLLIVQNNNIQSIETKNALVIDLESYILSSSNIINSLLTGSYTGSFVGGLSGTANSSSISRNASYSNTAQYLNYPNNNTSSYSISSTYSNNNVISSNATSASYVQTSSVCTTSSYTPVYLILSASNATTSSYSLSSSYANATDYLIYNGTDNGKVYRSILSEFSPTASFVENLSYLNSSTSSYSISASIANNASSSQYIYNVQNSNTSQFTLNSDSTVFSYINFDIYYTTTASFVVNEWKNIQSPGIGVGAESPYAVVFTSSFYTPLSSSIYPSVVCDFYISAFPNSSYVGKMFYFNRSYAFPIKNTGFGVLFKFGNIYTTARQDPTKLPQGIWSSLNGANVSVVVYAPSSNVNYPLNAPGTSVSNNSTLLGCARLS